MEELSQLIKDSAAGKARAQALLYQMFAPKMFGVCLRYSRDTTEAEDNLQDGFLRVFEKIGTFRFEGSFEGWIKRIMVNISLEKYRKHNLLYTVEDITVLEMPEVSDKIVSEISENDLLRLVQELPPRYRMVFNLYVFEEMSHKEIAEQMGISEGTSKSNLSRARVLLQKKVAKCFNQENNYSA